MNKTLLLVSFSFLLARTLYNIYAPHTSVHRSTARKIMTFSRASKVFRRKSHAAGGRCNNYGLPEGLALASYFILSAGTGTETHCHSFNIKVSRTNILIPLWARLPAESPLRLSTSSCGIRLKVSKDLPHKKKREAMLLALFFFARPEVFLNS